MRLKVKYRNFGEIFLRTIRVASIVHIKRRQTDNNLLVVFCQKSFLRGCLVKRFIRYFIATY